ncbi:MAG: flagellar basal body P-ring formation protein FlgA [Hyphomicrobiales bacterium]|nr:flagellar basal body P-ring formation protein FlgA [Hyphomicrobiales bacterium]MBV8661771.1 flagellar basal body P-ring formation protein FlgA [Hyphomicrobiales bacterium]
MRASAIVVLVASLGGWLAPNARALAQDVAAPTPKAVIYPGDVIRDDMLADLPSTTPRGPLPVAETRAAVVGKMSHRTLLPGAPIPLDGLDKPRLVSIGAQVQIVYVEGGLTITTFGAALQDGREGELIKVRNSDSGVTVMGAVQADGTVRVSG